MISFFLSFLSSCLGTHVYRSGSGGAARGVAAPEVRLAPLARPVRLVGAGNEPALAAGSGNVLIWKGKQRGLSLRTPKGKKIL